MKNNLNTIAFGFILNNDIINLVPFKNGKIGMGTIQISYALENLDDFAIGDIYICSNGETFCTILDSNYKKEILSDYFSITGEKKDGKDNFYMSETLDESKWNNAKKLIKNKNISIKFYEDISIEIEQREKELVKEKNEYYKQIRR